MNQSKLKEAQKDAEALWTYEDDLERARQNELYPSSGNRVGNLSPSRIEMIDIERSAAQDSWFFENFNDVDSADGIEILVRDMIRRLDVNYEIIS